MPRSLVLFETAIGAVKMPSEDIPVSSRIIRATHLSTRDRSFVDQGTPFVDKDLSATIPDRSFVDKDRSFVNKDLSATIPDRSFVDKDRSFVNKDLSATIPDRSFVDKDRSFVNKDLSAMVPDRSFADEDLPAGSDSPLRTSAVTFPALAGFSGPVRLSHPAKPSPPLAAKSRFPRESAPGTRPDAMPGPAPARPWRPVSDRAPVCPGPRTSA